MKFHVECAKNHVWGPPGSRYMTNFVKHVFIAKDALGKNHGKRTLKTVSNGALKVQHVSLVAHVVRIL